MSKYQGYGLHRLYSKLKFYHEQDLNLIDFIVGSWPERNSRIMTWHK